MRRCAWMVVLAAFILTGCSSARLVSSDPRGGVIAIPDSSDSWPAYHMTKARELMQKECPAGYTIVKQEEVVVGQTTTHNKEQSTKEVPLVAGLVMDVQQTTRNTTNVRDQTEWRIWYQRK